uniref:SFRICE_038047 n=1 Tax=Spodoptera frugiperda TaxID=7108 RepID=A0A2H1W4L9_SPOFR
MLSAYSRNSLMRNSTSFQAMLEAHIYEQHSATHDAAIVALLKLVEFLVKQLRQVITRFHYTYSLLSKTQPAMNLQKKKLPLNIVLNTFFKAQPWAGDTSIITPRYILDGTMKKRNTSAEPPIPSPTST